jgi:outer membrane biogenesis lipoprotein LolB
MKIHLQVIFALLFAALLLSGCSMLTARGRQEAAYARYVRKSSKGRVQQQRMFRSGKPSMPVNMPEEEQAQTMTTVNPQDSGPQAVAQNVP